MAGKVHAFLVGLGTFLMLVAGVLTVQLVSADNPPDRTIDVAPTGRAPSPSRAVGTGTPSPSATPTASTTTIRPSTTPPRTSTTVSTTTSTTPPALTWGLVWSDEFSGFDQSKWSATNNAVSDDACMTSQPQNLSVSSGVLTLTAVREPQQVDCNGSMLWYTSAHVSTAGIASFTRGAFEMRAKSPNDAAASSAGFWPGFWLSADDGSGAFDVVTLFGGASYATATQALYAPGAQSNGYPLPGGSPADGFHTYRVEWEQGVMRWYVDGALVWTRNASTTPGFDAAFDSPYHLHLNFAVGGSGGDPSGATLPATFEVDYVRVYQR